MTTTDWMWDATIFIVLFIGLALVVGGAAWLLEHEDGEDRPQSSH